MMLFSTVLPVASAPVISTPSAPFAEITLPSLDDTAADLVIGCVVDPDAVGVVAGIAAAEHGSRRRGHADVVGLDQVPRRPHAFDVNAVTAVGRDHVAGPGDGPSDHIAGRIDDARRIAGGARRLDQHPFGTVAAFVVKPSIGPMMPIWLPSTWLPDAPGSSNTPCDPLPMMTLSSCGSVPPRWRLPSRARTLISVARTGECRPGRRAALRFAVSTR